MSEDQFPRGVQNGDRVYLAELRLQCLIARHAYSFLQKYAASTRQNRVQGKSPRKSPTQLLCHGVAFIGAMTSISSILYPGGRRGVARALRLRRLLGLGYLPHTASPTIRHALMLISERLERLATNYSDEEIIVLAAGDPNCPRGIVLRRMDFMTLTISVLDQAIQIEACHEEIRQIQRALRAAHLRARPRPVSPAATTMR
jgi:hypothetical protein